MITIPVELCQSIWKKSYCKIGSVVKLMLIVIDFAKGLTLNYKLFRTCSIKLKMPYISNRLQVNGIFQSETNHCLFVSYIISTENANYVNISTFNNNLFKPDIEQKNAKR